MPRGVSAPYPRLSDTARRIALAPPYVPVFHPTPGRCLHTLKEKTKRELIWVGSDTVDFEIEQTPNQERRRRVHALAGNSHEVVGITETTLARAEALEVLGFGGYDALHLACAEAGNSDVFLTTDDKLLKRARRYADQLTPSVANPVAWLWERRDGS